MIYNFVIPVTRYHQLNIIRSIFICIDYR
ncbi:hypothetical protein GBAR_LOCUS4179 [Geodia barretti]|uniref:Uncharacterized protein n=1 Tax=Geodia barretti TaxID=519541 RepID=A0AA35R5V2_GEOBA|nr:hypothetical protein GBAR_LOCUS4179 [Geodia barretti]